MRPLLFTTMILGAYPLAAFAAPEPLAAGQAAQVLGGLAIVLVLIAVAAWAARRMQGWRPGGHGHIRIIEGMSVGTRDKLLLVEVEQQRVLIGMSPGRMQALASFPVATPRTPFSTVLEDSHKATPS